MGSEPNRPEQLLAAGILQQISRRSGLDGSADVRVRVIGGKDEHLHIIVLGPDPLGRSRTVDLRHLEIHQHEVWTKGLDQRQRLRPVGGLTYHLDVGLGVKHGAETVPHHGMIVRHQDTDGTTHGASLGAFASSGRALLVGMLTTTVVPPPGELSTETVPPVSWTLSCIARNPRPLGVTPSDAGACENPTPSSWTSSTVTSFM